MLPRPTAAPAPPPARLPAVRPGAEPALAVFDVEGTIADLTVVQHYLFFLLDARGAAALAADDRAHRDARARLAPPRPVRTGSTSSAASTAATRGWSSEFVAATARRALHEITLPRCFPRGLRRVREHVDAGHRVVLITGALDEVVRPLAELLEVELRAAHLRTQDGVFDGDLADTPPSAEARGALITRLAAETGARPAACYAYADSISDLSMLDAVGNPVPVNPDLRLLSVARRRGWPVQSWRVGDGGGRMPVVLPPRVPPEGRRAVAAGRR